MEVVKLRGSITGDDYYAIQVDIAGFNCLFRMPESQYSKITRIITGKIKTDDEPDQSDLRVRAVLTNAFNKDELLKELKEYKKIANLAEWDKNPDRMGK